MTRVVNKYKEKYDVYIGRGSKWGNPFPMSDESKRQECIDDYIEWFWGTTLIEYIDELKDKVLGCFCKPKDCHGDFLALLANNNIKTREEYYSFLKTKG